jgi:hypothetical protein
MHIDATAADISAFSSRDEMDADKAPILLLLKDAGIDLDDLDQTVIDSLPLWSTVVKLYGDKPRIVGLDTCEAFQATGDPADHFLGVAGTFNTGTNLLSELFIANCRMPARMAKYGKVQRGIRWQVRYVAEQSHAICIMYHVSCIRLYGYSFYLVETSWPLLILTFLPSSQRYPGASTRRLQMTVFD